jgi:hypothetical protein
MRPAQEFNEVQRLTAGGMKDCAIARRTGIPRPTVRDWRCRPQIRPRERASSACNIDHDFSALPKTAYSYLLGLHFGDGCIARNGRVWRLRIILDKKYPAIIDRCRGAIDVLMPGQRAAVLQRARMCRSVAVLKHWPCLIPQHGPGKKHTRRIALEPWQQALVDHATEEFIPGLIHSDGCRVVANDRGVRSVPYHFSNRSEDILGLHSGT